MSSQSKRSAVWAAWILIPIFTVLGQSCMKALANDMGEMQFSVIWLKTALISPWTMGVLACEIPSFLLWIHLLSHMDVSRAVPLTSISYLLILADSALIVHESITPTQLIGSALILAGVWLIGTAKKKHAS